MVYHKREKALICHHCGARHSVPEACPSCGNVDILPRGTGTERIEEELGLLFPERTVLRIDRDSAAKSMLQKKPFKKYTVEKWTFWWERRWLRRGTTSKELVLLSCLIQMLRY